MTIEDEYKEYARKYAEKKGKTLEELTKEEWNEVFHLFFVL